MKEKRSYTRSKVNLNAIIFATEEIKATVVDISEENIGLITDKGQDIKNLYKGLIINIQFIDDAENVMTFKALITRIGSAGDRWQIGCIVRDKEFCEYVIYKKAKRTI